MAFYFSSDTKSFYDTDVFPVSSLPANKVEITETVYTELMTKQNQGYVIMADSSGNPYTVNQSEASATDIKHAASVATTLALGHVKIGNTMTAANDGTLDVKDDAFTYVRPFIIDKGSQTTKVWAKVATAPAPNNYLGFSFTGFISFDGYTNEAAFTAIIEASYHSAANGSYAGHRLNLFTYRDYGLQARIVRTDTSLELWVKAPLQDTSCFITCINFNRLATNYADSNNRNKQLTDSEFSAYIADKTSYLSSTPIVVRIPTSTQVGSPSTPVYVDSNGQVQECDRPTIIDKIVNEDGTDIVISKSLTFEDSSSWKTLGKLNISPQDVNRIVDFTFMLDCYYSYDSQNIKTKNYLIFGVFVGNTEVARYGLKPSTDDYESSPSFRCSFTANINNTIYIKVQRSNTNEPHSASFEFPRVKGLIL